MEPCTRDIPSVIMTINNVIDYVTWLVSNLQTRDRFLNMSSKMGTISSINFVCQGEISCYNKPENWPVRSDYNSKWVIGAWAEAKGVCGFDLKILKKLFSLGRFRSYKKSSFMGRMYTPTLYAQRIKGIIIHLRKTVYINVYLHVNLTLLKVKTENKYN